MPNQKIGKISSKAILIGWYVMSCLPIPIFETYDDKLSLRGGWKYAAQEQYVASVRLCAWNFSCSIHRNAETADLLVLQRRIHQLNQIKSILCVNMILLQMQRTVHLHLKQQTVVSLWARQILGLANFSNWSLGHTSPEAVCDSLNITLTTLRPWSSQCALNLHCEKLVEIKSSKTAFTDYSFATETFARSKAPPTRLLCNHMLLWPLGCLAEPGGTHAKPAAAYDAVSFPSFLDASNRKRVLSSALTST